CEYYDAAWSYITYNDHVGYCMSRYLSSTKPSDKPTPAPTPSPSGTGISYKNFVRANYYVSVRPSTPSGFVNLRWAPSKSADVYTIYYAGTTLRVLSQESAWAQVYDEATGTCGFMMRSFLSNAGDGAGN
ncbi:MAG: SH3 domain-containing protein, partial [Bacillota bacterium]